MTEKFTPLLTTTDWNEEWIALQKFRKHTDSADYWDERSKTFSTKDHPNSYVESFLELSGIKPHETVFDMGCGTGAISIPLGEKGHKVVAADFSQGMLDIMQKGLDEKGIKTVFPKKMSWEDDWEQFGVREGMTDIAVASRSIATSNIKDSLLRLSSIARRRACITLSTGTNPRINYSMLSDLGLAHSLDHDYIYAFNILVHEGYLPEVSYIVSKRKETFDDFGEAFELYSGMIDSMSGAFGESELTNARQKLPEWLKDHLIENTEAGKTDSKGLPEKALCLNKSREIRWAFIAWSTAK